MKLLTFLCLFLVIFHAVSKNGNSSAIRIVTLAPHLTEMVYSAGAGHLLVGRDSNSDYPADSLKIPSVGHFNSINIEQIIKLNPTVVLSWKSNNNSKEIKKLGAMGINVIQTEIYSLKDIPEQIITIGKLTGHEKLASKKANSLRKIINELSEKKSSIPTKKVFYQIWDQPIYTVGKNQFVSQAIKLCGAKNVFGDHTILAPKVSIEAVIKKNPDIILLGGNQKQHNRWKSNWLNYPSITAVKQNRFINIDNSVFQRPTERFIRTIPALCKSLQNSF